MRTYQKICERLCDNDVTGDGKLTLQTMKLAIKILGAIFLLNLITVMAVLLCVIKVIK